MQVPIVRPFLGQAEAEAVARVIHSKWVAQGPEVAAFETEFSVAVGAAFAVATSSGTAALELCLRALNIGPGDDVLTVSHSFIATANCIHTVGARPVFVDIDPSTLGMDPKVLEDALTPKTRAIIAVHQLGFPCQIEPILEIAERRKIPVIEDAACALGSEMEWKGKWRRIGRPLGLLACFSFHPRKIITTGDGGMVTTLNESLANRIRRLRQHGTAVGATLRHQSQRVIFESYVEPAYNCRMTDMQAAMGRTQLAKLDRFIEVRRTLANRYHVLLQNHPLLAPMTELPWMRANYQSYPLRIRPKVRLSQTEIIQHMLDREVSCQRGVANAHAEPAYQNVAWTCGPSPCAEGLHVTGHCRRLKNSEETRDKMILIPLFHGMTDTEHDQVTSALRELA